jgi:hypothetical protein
MAAGRAAEYLWDYFPIVGHPYATRHEALAQITEYSELAICFEAPTTPGFVVPARSLINLGDSAEDFYVFPLPSIERIWAFSHEEEGAWSIDPARRVVAPLDFRRGVRDRIKASWPSVRSAADADGYLARNGLKGEGVALQKTVRLRHRIIDSLKAKGIRFPPQPLPRATRFGTTYGTIFRRPWNLAIAWTTFQASLALLILM